MGKVEFIIFSVLMAAVVFFTVGWIFRNLFCTMRRYWREGSPTFGEHTKQAFADGLKPGLFFFSTTILGMIYFVIRNGWQGS